MFKLFGFGKTPAKNIRDDSKVASNRAQSQVPMRGPSQFEPFIEPSDYDPLPKERVDAITDNVLSRIEVQRTAMSKPLELMVTLWPSFPHFERLRQDKRLSGIRLNSAMSARYDLDAELKTAMKRTTVPIPGKPGMYVAGKSVPLWFDLKGHQLRVVETIVKDDHLEVIINHPIEVRTPVAVLFKAGEDSALLIEVKGDGKHLVFAADGKPQYNVTDGESFHIRDKSLVVKGNTFTDAEAERIQKVVKAGFERYFLSYVQGQRDIDEFREFIGKDALVIAKIEDKKGLEFVARDFKKQDNLSLMAARGDLFVEVDKPHDILAAMKLIIETDPEASAGSRMLLSMIKKPVPDMADLGDLAWMYDLGYRRLMLCDELCLKDELLTPAINALDAFKSSYAKNADR